MRKAVGDKRFTLANGFQHAKLTNRSDLMLQTPSSGWKRLSWLAILPFLAGTLFLCNPVRAKVVSVDLPETALSETAPAALPDTTKESIPFQLVETKPTFNGSDANAFSLWVNQNLKYPPAAKAAGAQGRVVLAFTIHPDGKVRDVKVLRGANPDLDAEALRVVSSSPDWTPGYVKGEPVKVTYTFPVIFQLKGDKIEPPKREQVDWVRIMGTEADSVLFILDGKAIPSLKDIDPNTISTIQVLKDSKAVEKYGEKARNGVIEITTKKQ